MFGRTVSDRRKIAISRLLVMESHPRTINIFMQMRSEGSLARNCDFM